MPFKIAALLVTAGAWLGVFLAASSAAECGAAGGQPCKTDRVEPRPVATQRIGKTQSGKPEQLDPGKRHAKPASEKAAAGTTQKPAAEPQAAIDVKLSKIPDIIVPEPKGEAQPSSPPPAIEPEAKPGVAPPSPSDEALIRRHDPMP